MTLADNLEKARAALTMIQPEPFNAEAPPEALVGDITPAGLHYVRSNFALPAHDGNLQIGGAVGNPKTLTLEDLRAMPPVERFVTLECAGNGPYYQFEDMNFSRSLAFAHAADPAAEILIATT